MMMMIMIRVALMRIMTKTKDIMDTMMLKIVTMIQRKGGVMVYLYDEQVVHSNLTMTMTITGVMVYLYDERVVHSSSYTTTTIKTTLTTTMMMSMTATHTLV
jgi:hypothetical protein